MLAPEDEKLDAKEDHEESRNKRVMELTMMSSSIIILIISL